MLWWVLAGCAVEEAVVTSPLVGARRIDDGGVAAVVEVLTAGSYTYLRLEDRPESWLVVTGRAPVRGSTVVWRGYAELHDFASPRLDRTFDHLVFASIDAVEGAK